MWVFPTIQSLETKKDLRQTRNMYRKWKQGHLHWRHFLVEFPILMWGKTPWTMWRDGPQIVRDNTSSSSSKWHAKERVRVEIGPTLGWMANLQVLLYFSCSFRFHISFKHVKSHKKPPKHMIKFIHETSRTLELWSYNNYSNTCNNNTSFREGKEEWSPYWKYQSTISPKWEGPQSYSFGPRFPFFYLLNLLILPPSQDDAFL